MWTNEVRASNLGRKSLAAALVTVGLSGCLAVEMDAYPEEIGEEADALSAPNLAGANLAGVNLAGANLGGVNLGGANLGGDNLGGANLAGANLSGVNLGGANLGGANLAGSNLAGANLAGANLAGANLAGRSLSGSNLSGSNGAATSLAGTNLASSNLAGAGLASATVGMNIHNQTSPVGLLYSREDTWETAGQKSQSCVVMGIGSTAFARLIAENRLGSSRMYAAIKKLTWGFAEVSGGPLTLQAWEAVVWGGRSYCVFLMAAPPTASSTGIAGFIKAVWRWSAPPSMTIDIGAIGGGLAVESHSGMMDAGAKVLAGTLRDPLVSVA